MVLVILEIEFGSEFIEPVLVSFEEESMNFMFGDLDVNFIERAN